MIIISTILLPCVAKMSFFQFKSIQDGNQGIITNTTTIDDDTAMH